VNNGSLKIEYLDAVLEPGGKLLAATRIEAIARADPSRIDRRHVAHRSGWRVATHDHAGRHDEAAYIACRKIHVDPVRWCNQAQEQDQKGYTAHSSELWHSCVRFHLMAAMCAC
jgi:hypothetical protein